MNKEPIGLYIFRFVVGLGLFVFMMMLYWSSNLMEQNLKQIREEISQIRNDLLNLRLERQPSEPTKKESSSKQTKELAWADPTLPNLLTEDPFYQTTLPQMLGPGFKPKFIRREAIVGRPDNLHPFSDWSHIAGWISQCSGAVSSQAFGIYETFVPDFALKMELRYNKEGKPEYWVHLRSGLYWQPLKQNFFPADLVLAPQFLRKQPVTAQDFKFYFDAIMNPHVEPGGAVSLRIFYSDLKEFEVIDDLTFVVRWHTDLVEDDQGEKVEKMKYTAKIWTAALRPLPSFVYQYFPDGTKIITDDSNPNTYRTNPVWAQNFNRHWAINVIVSCGPWIFEGMTDREIRFKRNSDYYEPYAVLVEGLEIEFKDSTDTIWDTFRSGTLDLFQIPPNQLAELGQFLESESYQAQKEKGLGIRYLDFVGRSYVFVGWNEVNPLFQSRRVRQALTMAIDRNRIIDQYLHGMGIETTGTFFRYSPSYDPTISPYPFDPQRARMLLEEEGWYDSDGNGVIDKMIEGRRVSFRFTLTYYVKSLTAKAISEYIATALKEIGVICHLNGVDLADLSAAFDDKNFDAISLGWGLSTPPEDPKQIWYSSGAKQKGSSNAIGFANKEIDAIIDKLDYEYDSEKRIKLYHLFDKILYDEAPYTFLYTPKIRLAYREYLQNVFIPAERQDLIPNANVAEPQASIYWIKRVSTNPF